MSSCIDAVMFKKQYSNVGEKNREWNAIPIKGGELFEWDRASTYIQEPPFFMDCRRSRRRSSRSRREGAGDGGGQRDDDHISPAGNIKKDSPAGKYLMEHGVAAIDFNSTARGAGPTR